MKKTVIFLMALCLAASFAGCSRTENDDVILQESISVAEKSTNDNADSVPETTELSQSEEETTDTESSESVNSDENEETLSRILVAYFTYAENAGLPDNADASASASIQPWNGRLTGNTGVVADMIAQQTGGELFSIRTVKTYPSDYDGTIEEGQEEKNNNEYPELATHIENLDGYDTIFVGFPNWWYGMPMTMYSFFEEYDFSGKTIIPFCTSGGSGFSDAISVISEYEPEATILDGLSIGASDATSAENDITDWLDSLGLES
ncbi:MAG: flavodoxin [Oscillospiraceae bacterium]|nr:flavodoxin [Oscillospiraceae bacterium]